jgi:uncharacterized membrane protein
MPTKNEETNTTEKKAPTKKTTTTKTTTKKPVKKGETNKPKTTKKEGAKKTTSPTKKTPTKKTATTKTTKTPAKKTTTTKKETITKEPKKVEEKKTENKKDIVEEAMDVVENIMDTKDTTNKFKQEDINKNTAISIVAYIGIFSLIPYFLCKESKFAMFNAKQGINLFILEVITMVIVSVISLFTPWWISRAIIYVAYLIFILLSLAGIINVLNGKAKELPYVSSFKFIK